MWPVIRSKNRQKRKRGTSPKINHLGSRSGNYFLLCGFTFHCLHFVFCFVLENWEEEVTKGNNYYITNDLTALACSSSDMFFVSTASLAMVLSGCSAVSPQWDCCCESSSSGRVSPRGYCKALYQYIPPNRHLGFLLPILIWSIATWPWSFCMMRVPRPMKQMLEYHTWSDRNTTNCGVDWVFRASGAFAKEPVVTSIVLTPSRAEV